jgi:hypothetical protein
MHEHLEHHESFFFKALLTALFMGILDTIVLLAYNVTYRNITGYLPSSLVNVSSIIFAINLLLLAIGVVYFAFVRLFNNTGNAIFIVLFALLTIWMIMKLEAAHRFADPKVNGEYRGMMLGILLVVGVTAVCLPLLVKSKKFTDIFM